MTEKFINDTGLPFCKGCGHSTIANNTEKALAKLGLKPLDVIIVTDIGCHGLIDKSFNTHTVHGLHGRSVALGSGIAAGLLGKPKKVIVFVGDGGATIGMQHLIDAAHNGFDMTVVIHNNMLYGMTGGQPSEYTPKGFKTPTSPSGSTKDSYDICHIVAAAGASYVRRILGIGDISDLLAEAIEKPGFSLLEVMEICPSYGVKSNPEMKLSKVVQDAGLATELFVNKFNGRFETRERTGLPPLVNDDHLVLPEFDHNVRQTIRLMLCGSAGEGVQAAAEMISLAAVRCGLNITKKGSYPVTVGIGFSSAEVIISPDPILYTGTVIPDYMIIMSVDGLEYGRASAARMRQGRIFLDASLEEPATGAEISRFPFREKTGGRNASFAALFYFLKQTGIVPAEALVRVFNESKLSKKVQAELLLEKISV
jgi:pyruvate/2-oxoacid:ferredoxin oxidoreductase beta subunit/Pyruvate/2-oxoacid:ferredoxin oxidoreductase gamma subunit